MHYRHTQVGYWMAGAMVGLAAVIASRMQSLAIFGVMCLVTTLASALFGTLTVIVDDTSIQARFGPVSLLRERIAFADVTHARAVRNSPLNGWGIRYIRHGRLWNVWGLDAVELQLKNGTRFRLGTDEPQALLRALRARGISA
jgi:hypothetical protein